MLTDIDVNIIFHLGFITNIDIFERGYYLLDIKLYFDGENDQNAVAPIGMFSAPSSLKSKVRGSKVKTPFPVNMCEILDESKSFHSRSFLIRYKDEVHEMNESCHWKIKLNNIPSYIQDNILDIGKNELIPPVYIKLKLYYCIYDEDDIEETIFDCYEDQDSKLHQKNISQNREGGDEEEDDEPNWSCVGEQTLQLQHYLTGIHEYYPIRFKRPYFMNIDGMIHTGVTNIRSHALTDHYRQYLKFMQSNMSTNNSSNSSSKSVSFPLNKSVHNSQNQNTSTNRISKNDVNNNSANEVNVYNENNEYSLTQPQHHDKAYQSNNDNVLEGDTNHTERSEYSLDEINSILNDTSIERNQSMTPTRQQNMKPPRKTYSPKREESNRPPIERESYSDQKSMPLNIDRLMKVNTSLTSVPPMSLPEPSSPLPVPQLTHRSLNSARLSDKNHDTSVDFDTTHIDNPIRLPRENSIETPDNTLHVENIPNDIPLKTPPPLTNTTSAESTEISFFHMHIDEMISEWEEYSTIFLLNEFNMIMSIQELLQSIPSNTTTTTTTITTTMTNNIPNSAMKQDTNISNRNTDFTTDHISCLEMSNELKVTFQEIHSYIEFCELLYERCQSSINTVTSYWALFITNLPTLMNYFITLLKPIYLNNMDYFWKLQVYVQTCSLQYSMIAPSYHNKYLQSSSSSTSTTNNNTTNQNSSTTTTTTNTCTSKSKSNSNNNALSFFRKIGNNSSMNNNSNNVNTTIQSTSNSTTANTLSNTINTTTEWKYVGDEEILTYLVQYQSIYDINNYHSHSSSSSSSSSIQRYSLKKGLNSSNDLTHNLRTTPMKTNANQIQQNNILNKQDNHMTLPSNQTSQILLQQQQQQQQQPVQIYHENSPIIESENVNEYILYDRLSFQSYDAEQLTQLRDDEPIATYTQEDEEEEGDDEEEDEEEMGDCVYKNDDNRNNSDRYDYSNGSSIEKVTNNGKSMGVGVSDTYTTEQMSNNTSHIMNKMNTHESDISTTTTTATTTSPTPTTTATTTATTTTTTTSPTPTTTATTTTSPNRIMSRRKTISNAVIYAHGLNIFDKNIHRDVSKLPIIFIQQYTSMNRSQSSFFPNDDVIIHKGQLLVDELIIVPESIYTEDIILIHNIFNRNYRLNVQEYIQSISTQHNVCITMIDGEKVLVFNTNHYMIKDSTNNTNGNTVNDEIITHRINSNFNTFNHTLIKSFLDTAPSISATTANTTTSRSNGSKSNTSTPRSNVSFSDKVLRYEIPPSHDVSSSESYTYDENNGITNNINSIINNSIGNTSNLSISKKIIRKKRSNRHINRRRSSFVPELMTTCIHLVILQHGYLGTSYDMKLIQNILSVEGSSCLRILVATSNDHYNEDTIENMSDRLATEIYEYCLVYLPDLLKSIDDSDHEDSPHHTHNKSKSSTNTYQDLHDNKYKVSFIGHSMGGLVIRKVLESKLLKPLLTRLCIYISLATPHLGTILGDSQLVSLGQWAMSTFKKATALKQLSLQDASSIENSSIYKLSQNYVLGRFQKVILVSCPKDMYVPRYSATLRMNHDLMRVKSSTTLLSLKRMADNVLSQIDPDRLIRISIDYKQDIEDKSINNYIGRTAHICYLENEIFVQQLMHLLLPLFE